MGNKVQSDFLFAMPSMVSGAARVMDLFGQFDEYNGSATPAEADAQAIAADWLVVGQDIADVLEHDEETSELQVA